MKKLVKILGAVLALSLCTSCTINKTVEKRTITVSGTGSVKVTPDTACVDFEVNTSSWIAKQAVADNATIMNRVIEAIKTVGISEENIKTQDYSIGQEHSWQNGKKINGKYVVSNSISITVTNTDLLGQLIDDAVKAGANGVKSLTFKLADNSSALRQARTAAVKQAQDTAALLAGASGCKLGQAIKIVESNARNPEMAMYNMIADEAAKTVTSIQTGKLDICASVTITFELQ